MISVIIIMMCWSAGFVLLWRIPVCRAVDPELEVQRLAAAITIIIPARDEEAALPRLLESINRQDVRPAQIIVVDDASTDATTTVSKSAGATVIPAGTLPDGWRGKTWACQQGAIAATSQHLLFLDADTWFEDGGLHRVLAWYAQSPDVLSVFPFHIAPTAVEQFSAFFNLMMVAGIGGFSIFSAEPDGLFGQMLLINRDTFFKVGGYEQVRQHVLENVHLAPFLKSAGAALVCRSGKGSLSMRMYSDGFRALIAGWRKGFSRGAGKTSFPLMLLSIIWFSGAVMAASSLWSMHHFTGIILYAVFVGQFHFMLRRIGQFWFLTALLYPVPLLFFFGLFSNSLLRSRATVTWKGRTIHAG
jgi:4,4'-diaponeurosporenoate glycosyltransferase